jgi:hypothetical protein
MIGFFASFTSKGVKRRLKPSSMGALRACLSHTGSHIPPKGLSLPTKFSWLMDDGELHQAFLQNALALLVCSISQTSANRRMKKN